MLIRQIRQKQGLTIQALAKKARMSYTFLVNVELGKADPSLSTLKRLANALRVKPADLIKDE